jgi:hypothetical protein
MRAARASLLSCLALWLAACASTRTTAPRGAQMPAERPAPEEPATPPAPPPVVVEPPPKVSAPALPCICELAPPPHIRPKPKPQEPVKEPEPAPAEPAPPSANSVVDAEVGRMQGPLTSILGKNVQSPKGEDLGRVIDLLADPEGKVRVAIIDFGGFLGVGTRRIAVDWPLLHFNPGNKDKPLILTVTRQKLQSAPEYKDTNNPRVLMPPAAVSDESGAGAPK